MAESLLTQREFDTWRESDDAFKAEVRGFIGIQTATNLGTEGRLTAVEVQQQKCEDTVSRRTTWLSAVVSAIVGGLTGWFAR